MNLLRVFDEHVTSKLLLFCVNLTVSRFIVVNLLLSPAV